MGAELTQDVIAKNIGESSQNVNYEEVLQLSCGDRSHKLRIRIRSNPYEFQCFSIIDRWSGTKWHEVHSLRTRLTPTALYARREDATESDFRKDRDELVRVSGRVLFD